MNNPDFTIEFGYNPNGPGDPCDEAEGETPGHYIAQSAAASGEGGEYRLRLKKLVKMLSAFCDQCVITDQCIISFFDDNGHKWRVEMTLEFPRSEVPARAAGVPRLLVMEADE